MSKRARYLLIAVIALVVVGNRTYKNHHEIKDLERQIKVIETNMEALLVTEKERNVLLQKIIDTAKQQHKNTDELGKTVTHLIAPEKK